MLLTTQEFTALPDTGVIDPCKLRYAQSQISPEFQDKKYGTVEDLAKNLASGKVKPSAIPPLEIGEFGGMVWSFDTRRLVAFQWACKILGDNRDWDALVKMLAGYKKLDAGEVLLRLPNFDRSGSFNGVQCAIRQGGIDSPTLIIFRNPEFASTVSYMTRAEYQQNVQHQTHMSEAEFNSNLSILQKVSKGGVMSYP